MSWLSRFLHKSRSENHLDKELRFHLERQIADFLAAGMSAEEARRRARLEFGGLERVKEEVRDTRWETHLDNLFREGWSTASETADCGILLCRRPTFPTRLSALLEEIFLCGPQKTRFRWPR